MSKLPGSILKQYMKFLKSGQGFEHNLKNVTIISADDGLCKAEFTILPEQTNVFGYLHGGFSATLVDIISGIALLTHEKEGAGVSVNMNLNYLKSAKVGDEIIVEAKTLRAGQNLGFLEVEIKNKKTGELLVTGTHTKFIGKFELVK